MVTPNGRFITQRKICLSMSDFHPESWNPLWSVSSPTFRKLFPENVEKYEEQKLLMHLVQEQASSMPTQAENSIPLLDGQNRVEPRKDVKHKRRQSVPTWLLLLLVSGFGAVMALPLLQL